jgi:hypothetical protein
MIVYVEHRRKVPSGTMRLKYPYLLDLGVVNWQWVARIGLQLNQGDGTVWASVVPLIVPSECGGWEGLGRPGLGRANGEQAISAKGEDRSCIYLTCNPIEFSIPSTASFETSQIDDTGAV